MKYIRIAVISMFCLALNISLAKADFVQKVNLNQKSNAVILEVPADLDHPELSVQAGDQDEVHISFEKIGTKYTTIFNYNPTDQLRYHANFDLKLLWREYITYKPELLAGPYTLPGGKIISRSEWGADESLTYRSQKYAGHSLKFYADSVNHPEIDRVDMYDGDRILTWPKEYAKYIRGVVLHHTATTRELDNPTQAVRNIYNYHSKHLKWGDVGYHFLIAPNGQIFEGRKGGKAVIGGHTPALNKTTIGIAVLGNYQDEPPSQEALHSVEFLISALSHEYGLDPKSKFIYKQKAYPVVSGHRDSDHTLCPGEFFYDLIPGILNNVVNLKGGNFATLPPQLAAFESYKPNYKYKILLRNSGKETWQADKTYLLRESDQKKYFIPKDIRRFKTTSFELEALNLEPGFNNQAFSFYINGKIESKKINQAVIYRMPPIKLNVKIASDNLKITNLSDRTIASTDLMVIDQDGYKIKGRFSNTQINPSQTVDFKFTKTTDIKSMQVITAKRYKLLANTVYPAPLKKANIKHSNGYEFDLKSQSQTIYLELQNPLTTQFNTRDLKVFTLKKKAISVQPMLKSQLIRPGKSFKLALKVTLPELKNENLKLKLYYKGKSLFDNFIKIQLQAGPSNLSTASEPAKTHSHAHAMQPEIKILISKAPKDKLVLSNSKNLNIPELKTNIPANQKMSIDPSSKGVKLSFGNQNFKLDKLDLDGEGIWTVHNYENRPGWNKDLNDNRFLGSLIVLNNNLQLELINHLPIEDYLYGLGEVSNSAEVEKMKTIIVAARSYAYFYTQHQRKFGHTRFDLDDSPERSQKYLGYGMQLRSPQVVAAVKATQGEMVSFNAKVVKVPYFNQSAGRTKSAESVWGWKNTPYLVSRPDPYCKETVFKGHGVGISGCGASGMARANFDYKAIIQYYLPGVKLAKIY